MEPACLTSTPRRKLQTLAAEPVCVPTAPNAYSGKSRHWSDSSTIGEDWAEQQQMQEGILAGGKSLHFPDEQKEPVTSSAVLCHTSTQADYSARDSDTQTDPELAQPPSLISQSATEPKQTSLLSFMLEKPPSYTAPDGTVWDCFYKLSKKRQNHYTAIRSKLEHMVTTLAQRQELADVTHMTQGLGALSLQRAQKNRGQDPNPRLHVENVGMGTWPRARCVH